MSGYTGVMYDCINGMSIPGHNEQGLSELGIVTTISCRKGERSCGQRQKGDTN